MDPGFPFRYLFKEVSGETRASKRKRGKCKHWGCSRVVRSGKHDCNTCHSRKVRLKNRARYVFSMVRDSARKRKIPFKLTFEQFKEFAGATGYLNRVGRDPDSLTIDRIDPALPYQVGNIRALTWRENCAHLVEGMTDPKEPIARALAKAHNGDENRFCVYMGEAAKILEQVEILQRQQPEELEIEDEPF